MIRYFVRLGYLAASCVSCGTVLTHCNTACAHHTDIPKSVANSATSKNPVSASQFLLSNASISLHTSIFFPVSGLTSHTNAHNVSGIAVTAALAHHTTTSGAYQNSQKATSLKSFAFD